MMEESWLQSNLTLIDVALFIHNLYLPCVNKARRVHPLRPLDKQRAPERSMFLSQVVGSINHCSPLSSWRKRYLARRRKGEDGDDGITGTNLAKSLRDHSACLAQSALSRCTCTIHSRMVVVASAAMVVKVTSC